MLIREASMKDVKGIAKVHVDSWKSTYKGIVPESYLNTLVYEEREKLWESAFADGREPECLFVAEDNEGNIVGFASGGAERTKKYGYNGELYAIYLLESSHGQGVGTKLLQQVAYKLKELGYTDMLVWVLKDNPSVAFYQSFEPEKVDKEKITISGKELEEWAFGWKDMKSLLERS